MRFSVFSASNYILSIVFVFMGLCTNAQVIPIDRITDWSSAGLSMAPSYFIKKVNILDFGADSTGIIPTDDSFDAAQAHLGGAGVIFFPSGNFLFNESIIMQDSQVIQGSGATCTTMNFELGGSGDLISVSGSLLSATYPLAADAHIGARYIIVQDGFAWGVGDVAKLYKEDSDLVNDSWAHNTVAQIVIVDSIILDTLFIDQEIRTEFNMDRMPMLRKLNPRRMVGLECLKINRLDQTVGQTTNIHFRYAIDSWVRGVESNNCNFAHIAMDGSSHIEIAGSYFHHGFDYGGGGKAYGVVLQTASNLCLVKDNIFNHLRHSILLQSGANGNVVALNYSTDPNRSETFNYYSGDIVCHGNYPFLNLFEHNIVQFISVDNSHGNNGPFNTFFRNRAETIGIVISSAGSINQNLVGNEVVDDDGVFFGQYNLLGTGHFVFANNHLGTLKPDPNVMLPDSSYYFMGVPEIINPPWPRLGHPTPLNQLSIPAKDRFLSVQHNTICVDACSKVFFGGKVWTGCAKNADWHDTNNWSGGTLPLDSDQVLILAQEEGVGYFPIITSDVIIGQLVVEKNAKFECVGGATLTILSE